MINSDPVASALLQPTLDSDERLLWAGRPRQGLMLRASDTYRIPYSIVILCFSLFFEYQVLTMEAPGGLAVWGALGIGSCLYFAVGRFFYDSYRRARTYYGVSDKRLLLKVRRKLTSLDFPEASQMELDLHSPPRGTITFGIPESAKLWFTEAWSGESEAPRFDSIDQAKQIHDLIRTQRSA